MGIEALSRGADFAVFVERDREALASLRENLRLVPAGRARLLARSALEALELLAREGARFDLLFADPPYDRPLDPGLADRIARVAAPGASWAFEHRHGGATPDPGTRWSAALPRTYGDSVLAFYEVVQKGE